MAINIEHVTTGTKIKMPTLSQVTERKDGALFISELNRLRYIPKYMIVKNYDGGAYIEERGAFLTFPNSVSPYSFFFNEKDLDPYEEPTPEPDFTVANQPFTLVGTAAELRRFRDEWINLGYCSHRDKIEEGMGLLVNFEQDYPPYMRIHLDMFGNREGYELNKVREKLLEGAAAHAAKATRPPLKKSPDPVANPDHYNGKEVFNQMLTLYGKDQVAAFCRLNAFKYRMRAGKKDGNSAEQDIKKALWYEAELAELTK